MAISINTREDKKRNEKLEEEGLHLEYPYPLLMAVEVDSKVAGKKHKLLKLRNPWREFQWNGLWSAKSDKWTDKNKEQVNLNVDDQTTFWVDIEEAKYYFDKVQICKYKSNYHFSFMNLNHDGSMINHSMVRLEVPEKG